MQLNCKYRETKPSEVIYLKGIVWNLFTFHEWYIFKNGAHILKIKFNYIQLHLVRKPNSLVMESVIPTMNINRQWKILKPHCPKTFNAFNICCGMLEKSLVHLFWKVIWLQKSIYSFWKRTWLQLSRQKLALVNTIWKTVLFGLVPLGKRWWYSLTIGLRYHCNIRTQFSYCLRYWLTNDTFLNSHLILMRL